MGCRPCAPGCRRSCPGAGRTAPDVAGKAWRMGQSTARALITPVLWWAAWPMSAQAAPTLSWRGPAVLPRRGAYRLLAGIPCRSSARGVRPAFADAAWPPSRPGARTCRIHTRNRLTARDGQHMPV